MANSTLRRRISTLSSWSTWLDDEEISVGNPRRTGAATTTTWLDRDELTDLLAAAEAEGATPTRWCACSG